MICCMFVCGRLELQLPQTLMTSRGSLRLDLAYTARLAPRYSCDKYVQKDARLDHSPHLSQNEGSQHSIILGVITRPLVNFQNPQIREIVKNADINHAYIRLKPLNEVTHISLPWRLIVPFLIVSLVGLCRFKMERLRYAALLLTIYTNVPVTLAAIPPDLSLVRVPCDDCQ
jgi:hypothetical protein